MKQPRARLYPAQIDTQKFKTELVGKLGTPD